MGNKLLQIYMGVRKLFFQEKAKIYYLPEKYQKGTIFLEKSKKHTIMPGQGRGKNLLLPSLADAHADLLLQIGIDPSESQVAVVAEMTQHDTNPSAMRNKNVNCPV